MGGITLGEFLEIKAMDHMDHNDLDFGRNNVGLVLGTDMDTPEKTTPGAVASQIVDDLTSKIIERARSARLMDPQ